MLGELPVELLSQVENYVRAQDMLVSYTLPDGEVSVRGS